MTTTREVKLNDDVRCTGELPAGITADHVGSVIWVWDDLREEYGHQETHLVRFDRGGDLDRELVWFDPADLQVVKPCIHP